MGSDTPRAGVLFEAHELIHGDRNRHYGEPTENFSRIAELWNTLLHNKLKPGVVISPSDIAALMVAMKLARNITAPKRDTWVDIAGYAACGHEAQLQEQGE